MQHDHNNEQRHEHPISSYRQLLIVLGGLFILTALTVFSAQFDFGGSKNSWIALLIASTKSSLVLLFFMHLKYEKKLFTITFITTVFVLAIIIGFVFWDISFR